MTKCFGILLGFSTNQKVALAPLVPTPFRRFAQNSMLYILCFSLTQLQKLRAPCTKCTVLYLEKIRLMVNAANSTTYRFNIWVQNVQNRMRYQLRQQYLAIKKRGTAGAKEINTWPGINYLPAEAMQQSAPQNFYQTCTRTIR